MARILKIILLLAVLASSAGFAAWQGSRVQAAFSGEAETTPERSGPRSGAGGRARGAPADGAVPDIAVAEASVLQPVSIAYGRISAPRRAEIGAAISGEVVFVMEGLRDGAEIGAGDVLFAIDDAEAAATLEETRIALRAAEATLAHDRDRVSELSEEMTLLEEKLEIAEAELERTRPLVDRGLSGVATLDAARSSELSARQSVAAQQAAITAARNEVAQGEIAVEQAGLAVKRADRALAQHRVAAPIGGVFSGTAPLVGQTVTTAAIGEIVNLTHLEARLELSQAALSRITDAKGQAKPLEVEIRRPSGDVRAQARIDRLAIGTSSTGDESSVAIATLLAEQGAFLRPGDFVEARILEDTLDGVVALPASAVDPEGRVAFVDEAGRTVFETVRVIRQRGDEVFVDGAIAGRSYVVAPDAELGEGQAVVPQTGRGGAGTDDPVASRGRPESRGGEDPRAARAGSSPRGSDAPATPDQGEI